MLPQEVSCVGPLDSFRKSKECLLRFCQSSTTTTVTVTVMVVVVVMVVAVEMVIMMVVVMVVRVGGAFNGEGIGDRTEGNQGIGFWGIQNIVIEFEFEFPDFGGGRGEVWFKGEMESIHGSWKAS